ncbi:hypothetical protein QCE88_35810 [Caballeronia sp. LZ035]|nr:hypothetical protein [Caballeronia sp. LZ035]MDR5762382.1 hypothetical protein [Caballeronia sp. LZ035]
MENLAERPRANADEAAVAAPDGGDTGKRRQTLKERVAFAAELLDSAHDPGRVCEDYVGGVRRHGRDRKRQLNPAQRFNQTFGTERRADSQSGHAKRPDIVRRIRSRGKASR